MKKTNKTIINQKPLISIITPTYNASHFLERVINSVRNQKFSNYEHIIVDDCSSDETWSILIKIASVDARIRIIRLPENLGVVKARNAAINLSVGRYLAFLDVDDLWMPDKLNLQLNFMIENKVILSFTDYRFVTEDGNRIGRLLIGPDSVGWSLHHMTRYLGCSTVMLDRKYCKNFSFGEISSECRAEDFLAWSKIIKKTGPAKRCPGDLTRYALVDNSRSSNGLKAAKTVWRLYREEEGISLIPAFVYFFIYILFSSFKRLICRPIWKREYIDNGSLF